jgi:hypothetical protein
MKFFLGVILIIVGIWLVVIQFREYEKEGTKGIFKLIALYLDFFGGGSVAPLGVLGILGVLFGLLLIFTKILW